tara:strand:- start:170 stop:586 length:417 start_codon:yes stop_codon:yes gene_type:complete
LKGYLISPEDVAYIWGDVAPMLAKVTRHTEGELEPDDFLEPLTHGIMQLWLVTEEGSVAAVMVTQRITYPQKTILRAIAMSGDDFEKVRGFQDMIESYAIKTGCSALEMWGRKGWKKLLPEWKDTYIVYTKDLQGRMH